MKRGTIVCRASLSFVALLALSRPVVAQAPPVQCESGGPVVAESPIMAPVIYLSLPSFNGRGFATSGDWCASEYIAAQLEYLGLMPGTAASYFQKIEGALGAPLARNVIAVLEGSDSALREEVILIAAHHDHLESDTANDGSPRSYPGADDNASGVAALLYAARLLAEGPPLERTVMFVTFTGEEVMFRGSSYFAENPPVPLTRIVAMLNVDMVGRLGDNSLQVSGTGTHPAWPALLERARGSLTLDAAEDPKRGSDHLVFHRLGIPVLYINTGSHSDHHEPSDTWQKIDGAGLLTVSEFLARLVRIAAALGGLT